MQPLYGSEGRTMAVEPVPYCVYSSAEQFCDSGYAAFGPGSFSLSPFHRSPPPDPSHDFGLTREEFRSGAIRGSMDGASAPGPLNPRKSPLKSPAIRASSHIMDYNNFKASH